LRLQKPPIPLTFAKHCSNVVKPQVRAAIFAVIGAPRVILRESRRADHAGQDSQKAKQWFHGCFFLTTGVSTEIYVRRLPRAPRITIRARKFVGRCAGRFSQHELGHSPDISPNHQTKMSARPFFGGARISRFNK
jgi:hypothetical protein